MIAITASFLSKIITAMGNFSVQYNFQSISVALILMSESECTLSNHADCRSGEQSGWVLGTATAMVFVGAITGQLTMGLLGDIIGRNKAMTVTLSLVAFSALLSAVVPMGSASSIYIAIIVIRFFLGIGVGGIYPLSATKAAEDGGDENGKVDVTSASWAFVWQVPGSMTPWLLSLITSYTTMSVMSKWRLLLGAGAIPAFIVVVISIIEMYIIQNSEIKDDESEIKAQLSNKLINSSIQHNDINKPLHEHKEITMCSMLNTRDAWCKLAATGGGWFLYDIAYYGVNLFGGEILNAISAKSDDNVSSVKNIRIISGHQLIGLGTSLPAVLLSIFCLRWLSTKTLQIIGFLFISINFIIMAATFYPLQESYGDLLFFLYCLLLFSLSFGPNLTTYILPAETYPKKVRSSFNGISAACGKLGAFTGVYMFGPLASATSYPTVMVLCAIISVLGAVVSYVFIPGADSHNYEVLDEESQVTE
eukprot:gene8485-11469_t